MYGGTFKQHYWWYVKQTFLRFGIYPTIAKCGNPLAPNTNGKPRSSASIRERIERYYYIFLEDICPAEFQEDIYLLRETEIAYQCELERLQAIVYGPTRTDIPDDEVTYWRNIRYADAETMIMLRGVSARTGREFTTKIENISRQDFGFRTVGEGWINETMLFELVKRIPSREVLRHYRPRWLGGLELDIYIPNDKVAIEYQGQQHTSPIEHWGGVRALRSLQQRDKRKTQICLQHGVRLIHVDYTEPLTEEHIGAKVLWDSRT